jgi:hypothetical protein
MTDRSSAVSCCLVGALCVLALTGVARADILPLSDRELALVCEAPLDATAPPSASSDGAAPGAEASVFARCGVSSPRETVRTAALVVCSAHAARTIVPWEPSQVVAACIRDPSSIPRSVPRAAPEAPEPSSDRSTTRALSGTGLETAILRGTASFLVERAQKEMSLFATQAVSARLCRENSASAALFENTCKILDPRADLALGATPAALREAARQDLEALPAWAAAALLERDPELACAIGIGWSFAREAMRGTELVALLSDLDPVLTDPLVAQSCPAQPAPSPGTAPVASGAPLGGMVEFAMLTRIREVVAAFAKVRAAQGFDVAGMVRAGELDYLVSRTSRNLTNRSTLNELGKTVKEVLRRVRELDSALSALERDPSAERRDAVVASGVRTIEPVLAYAGRHDEGSSAKPSSELSTAMEAIVEIGNRQYAAAVVSMSKIRRLEGLSDGNVRNLFGLGATLAQADSSEAVKAAFEDAALPLQSWRRKNQERFGVTLTSMVGFHPAMEFVVENADGIDVGDGLSIAPALMVGVDLHWGLGGSRLGLHFNVLDLGALSSLRLKEPSVEGAGADDVQASEEPDVRVEQVFAPGFYPYFGAGPFDFGVGISFVPSLRATRNDATGNETLLDVVRAGVLVAVDLSLLPLL